MRVPVSMMMPEEWLAPYVKQVKEVLEMRIGDFLFADEVTSLGSIRNRRYVRAALKLLVRQEIVEVEMWRGKEMYRLRISR